MATVHHAFCATSHRLGPLQGPLLDLARAYAFGLPLDGRHVGHAACVAAKRFAFSALASVRGFARVLAGPWSRAERYLGGDLNGGAGEEHDAEPGDVGYETVVETAPSGAAAEGDAPPGLASGANVRSVRRKKVVYTPYEGCLVRSAYLRHVVAEVRVACCTGSHGVADEAVVRATAVRIMRDHGVRASHIEQHLHGIILAVMYVTDDDRWAAWDKWFLNLRWRLRRSNRRK